MHITLARKYSAHVDVSSSRRMSSWVSLCEQMSPAPPSYLQGHICIHSNELQLNSRAFYSNNKWPIYDFLPTPTALYDKDGDKILAFSRWNILSRPCSPRSWSSLSHHDCILLPPKLSAQLPPLCGGCDRFPSLPCREPTSSPLMWLRCPAGTYAPSPSNGVYHSTALYNVTLNHMSTVR